MERDGKRLPKYALIGGVEATLSEVVPHALSDRAVVVFDDGTGARSWIDKEEWLCGAEKFATAAAERGIVTFESRSSEKLSLFRSLFKGRNDTYAHGFRKRSGGISYAPACLNDRTRACPRWTGADRHAKCSECTARALAPLTDAVVLNHMRNGDEKLRSVVGLYVLDKDGTAWLLAADFDEGNWQHEAVLYRDECRKFGLFPAVERSRSGNGAHVWVFFDEPIEGSLARDLGCALITSAMSSDGCLGFGTYDRLFPTQSTVVEGGFGNLIALPFQALAQRNGNSVFVDDSFTAYSDQWRFLSSVKRASRDQVRAIVDTAADGPLGRLSSPKRGDTDFGSRQLALARPRESGMAFPPVVHVEKANMLFVGKGGLTTRACDKVRRLAAFGNPEFRRAQGMRRSVKGIPRIIWCGAENDSAIALPRGCERDLIELIESTGAHCEIEDTRPLGPPVRATFTGELRDGQRHAAEELLQYEIGVLSAPTGFGKTVVGAYLIATLGLRTLVIVPSVALVGQWRESLARFLDIEDDREPLLTKSGKPSKRVRPVIGQIGAGRNAPSGIVDVATFQSLLARDNMGLPCAKEMVKNYEMIICDECHHGAAPNLELVMRSAVARRVFGLSATPKRTDGLDQIVYMQCGPVRCRIDPREQAAEQGFRRLVHIRFTHVRMKDDGVGASFNQVDEAICSHEARDRIIAEDVAAAVRAGRVPLVVARRREHASLLATAVEREGVKVFKLTGEGTAAEKRGLIEQVRAASGPFAVIATGGYVDEGFDLPRLDTLMLASPYSGESIVTQYTGRLHRESDGKSEAVVYDYVDTSVPMLERMHKKRLKAYAALGYEVAGTEKTDDPSAAMMTAGTWLPALIADIDAAERSIEVRAPYASVQAAGRIAPSFSAAVSRGVDVSVSAGLPSSAGAAAATEAALELLREAGCRVAVGNSPLSGLAVIDGRVAWYGTLPLLALAREGDCSLRISSREIARDLESACGL